MKKRNTTVALISKRAQQIRKKNEPWKNAIKRASVELKKRKFDKKEIGYKPSGLYGTRTTKSSTRIPQIRVTYSSGKRIAQKVGSAEDAANIVWKLYAKNTIEVREQFFVLYLNNSNKVLGYHRHSVGGIKGSLVDLRILFSVALKSLATSIIVAHNHPSGALRPSASDIQITNKIKKAGELLDIQLLDHVILTKDTYYSFAENGKL